MSASSETDDDLPPSHQNRGARGGPILGNGRSATGAPPYSRGQHDMETQIHLLEQEAYCSVLRAFKAQSDAITWEKEGLITELRKELRVSDEEHRELLSRVNADDIIRRIREWRQAGAAQSGLLSNTPPAHESLPSPTFSASRKKQKTLQSLGAPSPVMHLQPVTAPSSPAVIRGAPLGSKAKKPKAGHTLTGISAVKILQIPSIGPSGKGQVTSRSPSGAIAATLPAAGTAYNPLIGRKVWTRWPEDNSFYEAVITDYNARDGLHALVYDINTKNETWECVNLKEISPEDIRWDAEDPGISGRPGHGMKRPMGQNRAFPGAGRGRGSLKNHSNKDFGPRMNGIGKKHSDDIEILHTETLIKEVERVIAAGYPDPLHIENAKKTLREHEQSLIDAIARLTDASDGESEDNDGAQEHRQWNPPRVNYEEQMIAGGY
ncbi:protein EMSY-LIKE 3-like isoform X1 [Asparagus officinalis]|uniref:protein EMSY-LIKE 3-like isoform X1 n=1 Tax=Asparagus officinalis TaxID=4686 RepID=UPI00098DEA85|nr:protein EMSY-LIKE 3-like isoform X1 [Asparagus officinalis]